MKYNPVIVFLFVTALHAQVFAQSAEIKLLIDTSVALMQKQSISKDSVNWIDVKKQMLSRTNGLNDSADLQNAMGYVYKLLNDPHGSFIYKKKRFGWFPDMPAADDSLEVEFDKGDLIKSQMLGRNIGYLRIPSMSQKYKDSLVRQLNEHLCHLLANDIKGVVIDLRLNGGGSMTPMILGVQQLLGDGILGGAVTNYGSTVLSIKNNALYIDTSMKLLFKPACLTDATRLPVVLLTSFETASSGEALLTSFMGRPNTLTIGVPTQGRTTGLLWSRLNEFAEIGIAATLAKDRNGKIYKTSLQPDIYMEATNKMNDIPHDAKVMAAVTWLVARAK